MFKLTLVILNTVISSSQSASVHKKNGCSITLPKRNDLLQPILLTNHSSIYSFAIPDGNTISYYDSEPMNLLCSPANNHIEGTYNNLTSFLCDKDETFKHMNRKIDFDNIHCKSYVKASISKTRAKCGNGDGNIVNIGYQTSRKQFLTLITSCFDSKSGNVLYSNHTVYGQAVAAISQQRFRPPFSEEGLPYDLHANDHYKQKTQKNMIERLLGSNSLVNLYYPNNAQFLSRGHLSPDADFIYAPMQFATYFYINVCPQWQSINAGNWKSLEVMVRKAAKKMRQPLQVYTGTHDILTLPDVRGKPVEIYLEGKQRIPVPKFLWKVLYNEQTKQGIAFVSINNPFLDDVYSADVLCANVCDEYNWHHASFDVIKKGYIYCCNVLELKQIITTIPYLRLQGVLKG